jgi:hypothetical protein
MFGTEKKGDTRLIHEIYYNGVNISNMVLQWVNIIEVGLVCSTFLEKSNLSNLSLQFLNKSLNNLLFG